MSPYTSARVEGEVEESTLADDELFGSYRERLGWGRGRKPGSLTAVGPTLDSRGRPLIS